jgi:hypothetical protein
MKKKVTFVVSLIVSLYLIALGVFSPFVMIPSKHGLVFGAIFVGLGIYYAKLVIEHKLSTKD